MMEKKKKVDSSLNSQKETDRARIKRAVSFIYLYNRGLECI